ncbi:uncharacterized protein K452DRAFT_307625 [Neofusicoccum parvum]|nr:uncharacterized protein K452DRAFT_307625 [Neofusicoccum parvum]
MADGNRVRYMMHYYGMSLDYTFNLNDTDFSPPTPADPYTYMYPDLEGGRWEPEYQFSASPEYSIASLVARYYNGSFSPNASNFKPLPGLGRPDYELMLFFLSTNTVMFSKETDDPWYSAHTDTGTDWSYSYKNDNKDTLEGEMRFYFADAPASAVGCTEQMQVCNPNSKTPEERCTSIMAKVDLTDTMIPRSFWASQRQRSLFWYFSRFMLGDRTQLTDLIDLLGVFSLTSRNSLRIGIQGPIPDNQWQLDMESMHAATLSILQGNIFDFAAGPSDPSVLSWLRQGSKKEFKYACENQKIRSTAYTSFNTFGLCITLTAGAFIILLSYTVEPLVGRLQRRCGRDAHARLEWCTNETLQLQRLAHEELGLGGRWAGAADAVPVTEGAGGRRLGVLDVADPTHPRLKAPPADLEIVGRGGEGGRDGDGRDGKGAAVVREVSGGSSASSTDVEERRERMGEAQLVSPISASSSCP